MPTVQLAQQIDRTDWEEMEFMVKLEKKIIVLYKRRQLSKYTHTHFARYNYNFDKTLDLYSGVYEWPYLLRVNLLANASLP